MILKKLASQLINVWERSEKWSSTWILELRYPKRSFDGFAAASFTSHGNACARLHAHISHI